MTLVRPSRVRALRERPSRERPSPERRVASARPPPAPGRAEQPRRSPKAAASTSAFADPAYRSYLTATAVSCVGDATWFVALGWGAAQLGDPVRASMVLAAGTIPRALLLPLGGAVADRFGLRRLMVGGDLTCALVMVAATVIIHTGQTSATLLAALAALVGFVDAVNIPASAALPRLLLDEDQLPSGNGLLQLLGRLSIPVGAPLGGLLVAQGGLAAVTAVNALTYVVSATLVARLRLRDSASFAPPEESLLRSMVAGVTYVRRQRSIAVVLGVMTVANMMSGPVIVVGIPMRASTDGWGAQGLGWFSACFAVGAGLGTLGIIKRQVPLRRAGSVGMAWLIPQALLITSLSLAPSLPSALVLGAATGVTAGPASALLLGLAQGSTEVRFQARVMSLLSFAGLGLAPIAFAAYGVVAELTSLRAAGVLFGVAELVVAAYGLLWFIRHRPLGRHASTRGRHRRDVPPGPVRDRSTAPSR